MDNWSITLARRKKNDRKNQNKVKSVAHESPVFNTELKILNKLLCWKKRRYQTQSLI